jgi:signal transduction histidine kinase
MVMRERTRLAQRLHDDAIPTLLTAAQSLRDARAALGDEPSPALEAIHTAAALLTVSVNQLRETAADLVPAAPAGLGLEEGVQLLAKRAAERGGFEYKVRVDGDFSRVDTQAALTIIRELLTNVERHAHANCVSVEVAQIPRGGVRITVSDDGTGLSKARMREAVAEGHIGLLLVAARVEELGGTFDIARAAGRGARLTITLPA